MKNKNNGYLKGKNILECDLAEAQLNIIGKKDKMMVLHKQDKHLLLSFRSLPFYSLLPIFIQISEDIFMKKRIKKLGKNQLILKIKKKIKNKKQY